MEFERFLDLLIAKGVRKYRGPFIAIGQPDTLQAEIQLDMEFGAPPAPAVALVDAKGEPVNLDEGLPDLAKDPDADPLVAANFPAAKAS